MRSQHGKPSSQKLSVYETLHSLNEGFEGVLGDLRHLQGLPFFHRQLVRAFQVVVEETRAWVNFELVETMHEREQSDWARFGRLRNRWEKRYRDPEDILLEAEQLKRTRHKAAVTTVSKRGLR